MEQIKKLPAYMEQIKKLPAYIELENIIINFLKEKIEEDEQQRKKTI